MRLMIAMMVGCALMTVNLSRAEELKPAPAAAVAVDPAKALLHEAVADWVNLLEKGDAKAAADRWAAGEKAQKELAQYWDQLKAAHEKHDYRTWIDRKGGAKDLATTDVLKFKVGGHEYAHMHTEWEHTRSGWRIVGVWMCR
jgi:hypothetical protein